jgi:dihydrofolate reductase
VAQLVYSAIASLDGYVADADGNFGWAKPDEEVHSFVNEQERPVGTYLYGRRMYEVMKFWEGDEAVEGQADQMQEYAEIWRAAEKVVYSRTLTGAATTRTRVERDFDPDAVRQMKAGADTDIGIGGPTLAAEAFRTGLVDECHLVLAPVIVGAGTRALPDGVCLDLELVDERRFRNGFVHLHYRALSGPDSSAG